MRGARGRLKEMSWYRAQHSLLQKKEGRKYSRRCRGINETEKTRGTKERCFVNHPAPADETMPIVERGREETITTKRSRKGRGGN